jgi:hypothetical protein
MIGVAMGINNLLEIFNEKYYDNLEGGILESFGRLFRHSVKLYIYPMRQDAYDRYLPGGPVGLEPPAPGTVPDHSFAASVLINAKNVQVVAHLRNLYNHLLENHYLECIVGFDQSVLHIFSRDVLRRIQERDATWEQMVPTAVAAAIKRRGLFGCTSQPLPAPAAAR